MRVPTTEEIFRRINRDDAVCLSALVSLVEHMATAGGPATADVALLAALATQAQENQRRCLHGHLPQGYPALSRQQLDQVRCLLKKYGRQLSEIAAEKTAARARRETLNSRVVNALETKRHTVTTVSR